MSNTANKFDKVTAKRLFRLVKPFFTSEMKWKAWGLLLLLGLLALSIAGVNVLLSYIARDFMNAFNLKEKSEFFRLLWLYLLSFALATPVAVFYSYVEQRLALLWRRWLSLQVLRKYFANMAYYKISGYEGIDNPDQRLEEDIRSFTATALSLFLIICNSILALVLFMGILWSISLNLLLAVLGYAFLGSFLTYYFGRPLIQLSFDQLRKEANYRYKLVNVRDNAESIAFYRGDRKEFTRARQRLKQALENFRRIVTFNRNLGFLITGYNNLKPVLPVIVVSPLYLSGSIPFGVVTQSTDAFIRVLDALSILVQHFGTISALTAVVTRLGSFSEALESFGKSSTAGPTIEVSEEPNQIATQGVTILTPKRDRVIIRDLSFTMQGGGLLITGPSGSGKSSILRVFAGLWNAGTGRLIRPPIYDTLFVPQRPYMVLGSLRNQLLYSLGSEARSDEELEDVLEQVGLEETLKRAGGLGVVLDWPSILSTGEQQRLAFARVVLRKPRFLFLDEATTALDPLSEEHLYNLVRQNTENFISVGYRSTLVPHHQLVLELQGDGAWRLEQRR